MATVIRLKRVGAKKEASYRIIVTDSREGTSGAAIERLGNYNPRTQPSMIKVNAARTLHWLHEGAEPSDTVKSLLQKTGVWKQFHDGVTADGAEQEVVFLGPPEGERGTSQRPMPTDRKPKAEAVAAAAPVVEVATKAAPADEPAEEAAAEAEEAPADEPAEEAAAEAEEAPADEPAEEAVAEAEEAPADEPAEEAAAEAEEAPAEAEEAPADEPAEEAAAEAEETPADEPAEEAAADADADGAEEEDKEE